MPRTENGQEVLVAFATGLLGGQELSGPAAPFTDPPLMLDESAAGGAPKPAATKTKDQPKPCCVCKDEKSKRDECMLMASDPDVDCKPMVEKYKECMAGYGFKI
ncbi:hypothetical protein MKZ38_008583 [Zalerion maritima]|uniref:Cytochrome c oxidase copper chaperone n=1 Tax=Zalerion maritima TaxID=339359 RepID=A0AAD5S014_9PEZI|nr:hypothetical protein MKZ38_008583 [Zalerion maritima]